MSFIMRILFAFLFFLTALPAHAVERESKNTINAFYGWVLGHPATSLPSANERQQLASFLSPALMGLLAQASDAAARCETAALPGEKPLSLEGDLFAGNDEGASEVAYGEWRQSKAAAAVDVSLVYIDPKFPKAHEYRAQVWKNRVELGVVAGAWRILDVRFDQGTTLSKTLKTFIAEGARSCGPKHR